MKQIKKLKKLFWTTEKKKIEEIEKVITSKKKMNLLLFEKIYHFFNHCNNKALINIVKLWNCPFLLISEEKISKNSFLIHFIHSFKTSYKSFDKQLLTNIKTIVWIFCTLIEVRCCFGGSQLFLWLCFASLRVFIYKTIYKLSLYISSSFLWIWMNEIGVIATDLDILKNFLNGLVSQGGLTFDSNSLCTSLPGIVCSTEIPPRVTKLYDFIQTFKD